MTYTNKRVMSTVSMSMSFCEQILEKPNHNPFAISHHNAKFLSFFSPIFIPLIMLGGLCITGNPPSIFAPDCNHWLRSTSICLLFLLALVIHLIMTDKHRSAQENRDNFRFTKLKNSNIVGFLINPNPPKCPVLACC